MSASLRTRVSVFITLIILSISFVSTYLLTAALQKSKEREFDVRGSALSFALSKAAEEGLVKEDLNLLKKASYVIKTPGVIRAQVFSNIWEAVDAFPIDSLHDAAVPEAIAHFKESSQPFHVDIANGYDYYTPVLFRTLDDENPSTIGFVRITLSPSGFEQNIKRIAAESILIAVLFTVVAIVSINLMMRRLVVQPVMLLHRAIARFKQGGPYEPADVAGTTTGEIRELAVEFNRMAETVRQDEARLVESERRIRALFERVEHAIFRTDPKGFITEANDRFRQLFGGVAELCDIIIGDIDAATCLTRAAAEHNLHVEDRAIARNGDEIMIALSLYPERDASGAITGYDGYIIDVTEKKRMEERLIRSQKLEAVGTLAAGMAHDFNNLLTAILGYSGIMLKMTREDDPFHKPVTVIHEAAKRGAALGKKILAITRKEKMEAKPVNINDLVRHSLDLLQTGLPKNIEIALNLDETLPHTMADPSQMQQVIINLAVNGRDAMPDGGRLSIETSLANPANGLSGIVPPGGPGFIKLTIADTGVGIDLHTQSKIFDPFFTTKEVGKGTGLGLYIVHSIVTNHGGYINLYSEPGQGTRFNIYLPVARNAVVADHQDADIRGTETILVIDDEAHVRDLCKDMLIPLGYTVLTADSGSNGLALYREKKDEIALVVLDVIMPKMNGHEVFHALRTINRNAVILLYSGYSQHNYTGISELMNNGAAGFIQKPFSLHDFGVAIRKAMSR